MTSTSEALARAIDYLGADEVAPGRYAVLDHSAARWYLLDAETLALVTPCGNADESLTWLASRGYLKLPMPAWWSPERRTAWRSPLHDGLCAAPKDGTVHEWHNQRRITANLETGEEIPT